MRRARRRPLRERGRQQTPGGVSPRGGSSRAEGRRHRALLDRGRAQRGARHGGDVGVAGVAGQSAQRPLGSTAASGRQVSQRQLELGRGGDRGLGLARGGQPGGPSLVIGSALGQDGAETQQRPAAGPRPAAPGGQAQQSRALASASAMGQPIGERQRSHRDRIARTGQHRAVSCRSRATTSGRSACACGGWSGVLPPAGAPERPLPRGLGPRTSARRS